MEAHSAQLVTYLSPAAFRQTEGSGMVLSLYTLLSHLSHQKPRICLTEGQNVEEEEHRINQ